MRDLPGHDAGPVEKNRLRLALWPHQGWLALAGVVLLAVLAVGLGSRLSLFTTEPTSRSFTVTARQFAYSPGRLSVNQGDRVAIRLFPIDVTHGLHLDGYGLDTSSVVGGLSRLEFVADKPGVFRFHCSVTCGPLHPFMIGEIVVEPNTPFGGAAVVLLLVTVGAVGWSFRGNAYGRGN